MRLISFGFVIFGRRIDTGFMWSLLVQKKHKEGGGGGGGGVTFQKISRTRFQKKIACVSFLPIAHDKQTLVFTCLNYFLLKDRYHFSNIWFQSWKKIFQKKSTVREKNDIFLWFDISVLSFHDKQMQSWKGLYKAPWVVLFIRKRVCERMWERVRQKTEQNKTISYAFWKRSLRNCSFSVFVTEDVGKFSMARMFEAICRNLVG